ncbi:MAG: hypothetical protein R3F62_27250 [Planctomycetota bacterium]
MSPAPPSDDARRLERALRRGARRLSWARGVREGAWAGFGAVWGLELWAIAPGALGAVGAAASLGCAAYACTRVRPVATALAAAVADARLGGAAISAGAEALDGGHPRFAAATTRQALSGLEGLPLARWARLAPPAGWPLGLLIAVLLPLAWLGQPRAAAATPSRRLPGLLDPTQLAAAGGGAPEAALDEPGAVGWAQGADALEWSELAPEVLAALGAELAAQGSRGAGAGPGAPGTPSDSVGRDADGRSLEAWAQTLAAEALAGDRAAQATLAQLGDAAGAGGGASAAPSPLAEPDSGATIRLDTARGRRLQWELRVAERRYFTHEPTGR